jgi:microcystin-dependent protein
MSLVQSAKFNDKIAYFAQQHPNGNALLPAGLICHWAGLNTTPIPAGWLICNGNPYDKDEYSDLFNAIGYTYGGSGQFFNVPNAGACNIRGASPTFPLASKAGSSSVTMNINQMPSHTHSITDPGHVHNYYQQTSNQDGGVNRQTSASNGFGPILTGRSVTNISVAQAGSATPFTIQDPYIVLYVLIKENNEGY